MQSAVLSLALTSPGSLPISALVAATEAARLPNTRTCRISLYSCTITEKRLSDGKSGSIQIV